MGDVVVGGFPVETQAVDADGGEIGDEITDEELEELALAADPDLPLDPAATPIASYLNRSSAPLPAWYMPAVVVGGASRLRTAVVIAIIAAFLLVTATGLCVTYGQVVVA